MVRLSLRRLGTETEAISKLSEGAPVLPHQSEPIEPSFLHLEGLFKEIEKPAVRRSILSVRSSKYSHQSAQAMAEKLLELERNKIERERDELLGELRSARSTKLAQKRNVGSARRTAAIERSFERRLERTEARFQDRLDGLPSIEQLSSALMQGKSLGLRSGSYLCGLVMPGGRIETNQPELGEIAESLTSLIRDRRIDVPAAGVPIVIDRGHRLELEQILKKEIIPKISVDAILEYEDSEKRAHLREKLEQLPVIRRVADRALGERESSGIEALPYPFFRALMTEDRIPAGLEEAARAVREAPTYRVHAAGDDHRGLAALLEESLERSGLKTRLTAIDLSVLNYAEQLELKEILVSLLIAGVIAVCGELAVESGVNEGLARGMALGAVDLVDNSIAEIAMAVNELKANNAYPESFRDLIAKLVGPDFEQLGTPELLKRLATMDGPAGQILRRAFLSALKGAATGTLISLTYTGPALANDDASTPALVAAGAVGSFATSLGIIFNTRVTLQHIIATGIVLYREDRLPVPSHVYDGPKPADGSIPPKVLEYIEKSARHEMAIRSGFWGSHAALPLTLLAGLILAVPVPPEHKHTLLILYTTVAAGSETILRGLFSWIRLGPQMKRVKRRLQGLLAERPVDTREVQKKVDHVLAASFREHIDILGGINRAMTLGLRLPSSARRKLEEAIALEAAE